MTDNRNTNRTKIEVASQLGISVDKLSLWADQFAEWLDIDSRSWEKLHDKQDITIFTLIAQIDRGIRDDLQYPERRQLIESFLFSNNLALKIHSLRIYQKSQPEILRWKVVNGELLRTEFSWISVLAPYVLRLMVFGCWASNEQTTCAESYALTWLLGASETTVVDKNEDYIQNGRLWLKRIRAQYQFFQDYNLNFQVGDLSDHIQSLPNDYFDLSFCRNVLYNLEEIPNGIENAIKEMTRVVRPGGWIVTMEGKIGVEYEIVTNELIPGAQIPRHIPQNEQRDISDLFQGLGLKRFPIENIPDWTYVF